MRRRSSDPAGPLPRRREGTEWRPALTRRISRGGWPRLRNRRLIERHGFTIVAVEADWPDAAAINRFVAHEAAREVAEPAFTRFPTWMWRNTVIDGLVHRLGRHNARIADPARRAGFYGLDISNLQASIAAVLGYLDEVDPEAARVARERYGCLTPWQSDPATYGRAVLTEG